MADIDIDFDQSVNLSAVQENDQKPQDEVKDDIKDDIQHPAGCEVDKNDSQNDKDEENRDHSDPLVVTENVVDLVMRVAKHN